ncbi:4-hydroxybutyrate CoA-transferase [Weeksellaceae bacterium KMM 9713]|uniref:4-hydroxybutyrate CoA-transferase n=1 Tax=Profundicola chukchiensis TaxID=2961959 RepID=A0A9X4N383_9FLAO|nr:acetyl-CoA hydrolase/transferase C-terminal domain-containing protein [Profundicola chukchiensis]MDG4946149.1 4-hydroxybutyrate CoA-transferase [Profundicola chukchiensis]
MKFVSAHEAVKEIQSGNRVFVQSAAMTPLELVDAMSLRYQELKNVEVIHIHTEGEAKYTQEPYNQPFHTNALFVGANTRKAVNSGAGSYTPMFLGDVHILFRRNILPIDVALIQVSPPDQHGFCSLGVSIDITLPAIETAKKIIAQVNPNVPRTHGDGIIHKSRIDAFVESNSPIYSIEPTEPNETDIKIGAHVAGLVEDGATLQMGIGAIPNVVLSNLGNHKNLGIHTEMFSDGVLPLYESGVITGKEKQIKTGKIVTCFAMGSQKLYDFVNENPVVHFKEAGYTNDTAIIRRNPKVTAINSAIEIDLTGQVCADTIGSYQFSGVGGQMDFIRGASLSEGGKPIFALASQTKKGVSKIVPQLKVGAGVTTTRAHVHYIATEFGVVNLFAKSLRERAKLLISIAHPDHQEELEKQARELNLV